MDGAKNSEGREPDYRMSLAAERTMPQSRIIASLGFVLVVAAAVAVVVVLAG